MKTKIETLKSKRFIIRKSLIGKGIVVEFTDYDGKVHKYSHTQRSVRQRAKRV